MENKSNILSDYKYIVIETDTENPITIAKITQDDIEVASGYRARLKPTEG